MFLGCIFFTYSNGEEILDFDVTDNIKKKLFAMQGKNKSSLYTPCCKFRSNQSKSQQNEKNQSFF